MVFKAVQTNIEGDVVMISSVTDSSCFMLISFI